MNWVLILYLFGHSSGMVRVAQFEYEDRCNAIGKEIVSQAAKQYANYNHGDHVLDPAQLDPANDFGIYYTCTDAR